MSDNYKRYKDAHAICIDWETSGSDWGKDSSINYQGISMGAVVYNTQTFEVIDTLYVEIKFDDSKYKWSAGAEAIHGLSREHLEQNGVSQTKAAELLARLIIKYFDPQKEVLFLGHNRDFDVAFTKQLLEPHGLMFKISHTHLDTSGIAYTLTGLHRSDDIFDYLKVVDKTRDKHNALDDALMTVDAARRLRLIFELGLKYIEENM